MIINYKPISLKTNEWMPQEQVYFSQEEIQAIIEEEKLKENMKCIQGVGFDTTSQTLLNVVIDCKDYNGEFIYLIQSKDIVKGREWYFGYVSNKYWNTAKKVVLELTIDTITSNYDLFNDKKFKGQVYIERTNNYQRSINDTHSNTCGSIENKQQEVRFSDNKIDANIDIFTSVKTRTRNGIKIVFDKATNPPTGITADITTYGAIINGNSDGSFIAFQATMLAGEVIKKQNLPTMTATEAFAKYSNSVYTDKEWHFDYVQDYVDFLDALNYGHDGTQIDEAVAVSQAGDTLNSWMSVPRFFEGFGKTALSSIEYKIDMLEQIDLKNHTILHYNYSLLLGNSLKIPLDLLRLIDNTIFITRIISENNVIFKFYYNKQDNDSFYEVTLPFSNGMNNNEYRDWQRSLQLQYQAGAQNKAADFVMNAIFGLVGLGTAALTGGGSLGFAALFGAMGGASLFRMPFDAYKEYQTNKYKALEITQKGNSASNILASEVIQDLVLQDASIGSVANLNSFVSNPLRRHNSYLIIDKNGLNAKADLRYRLLIEKPIQDDIDKIDVDQELYGNIVNQTFISLDNPLIFNDLTSDHLYWQGKILPDVNPIDNFQLDILNETLAKGIYILKRKSDAFNIKIISSKGDFNIKNDNPREITDVDITSSSGDLNIEVK